MDFLARRGQNFQERFDFKSADNKPIAIPAGELKIFLTHGTYAKEYSLGNGLNKQRATVFWTIPAAEVDSFAYNTMYYTLVLNDLELARGVLRVQ